MNGKKISLIRLIVVLLLWSSSYAITHSIVQELPPILFAFLRFVIASLVMCLLSYFRKTPVVKPKRNMTGYIIILSLTGISFYYILFNFSLLYTPASTGALIQGFIPIAVCVLAVIFLKERLSGLQVIGIIISVTGVVLLGFLGPHNSSGHTTILGPILMIIAVICWAIYTIISKKFSHLDLLWLTTRFTVVGTLLLTPGVVIECWGKPFPHISLIAWAAIVYLGIFTSALSYLWYNASLRHVKASTVGVLLNLDPVLGAVIAVIFLSEPFHLVHIIGAGLVILGVFFSSKR